ncbi:protein kinase [Streptomyces sp. NPDC014636]|uniref:serine/threonine-protein kinase n=1 Tax=Streptomyces sp. NPDC014636 TaxID=3364876 RepID=UPI0037021E47
MEKLGPGDQRALPAGGWGKIGAYRLLARLGAGGMGHVYLARSDRGRTVAVKLVREELAEQEEFRARFRQEVQAARRVGGHWTAPVLDADTEAAVPWVATGYVAGPSLQQVVGHDHGALPERSVRILAAGLAQALKDIHAAGIVHRDLKPSNVLVTIDGPRVIDFGIARALETATGGGEGLTRTGSLVGSPGFMAPEQVRGDRITPACDVFCLGSVLAYAATGALPFGAANSGAHALMFRIAQEEPNLTGVPEGIADLVRHCLRKDPGARPSLDVILERTGVEDTVVGGRSRDPWLPSSLVAQLGRHAVQLLEVENPERGAGAGASRAGASRAGASGAGAGAGASGAGAGAGVGADVAGAGAADSSGAGASGEGFPPAPPVPPSSSGAGGPSGGQAPLADAGGALAGVPSGGAGGVPSGGAGAGAGVPSGGAGAGAGAGAPFGGAGVGASSAEAGAFSGGAGGGSPAGGVGGGQGVGGGGSSRGDGVSPEHTAVSDGGSVGVDRLPTVASAQPPPPSMPPAPPRLGAGPGQAYGTPHPQQHPQLPQQPSQLPQPYQQPSQQHPRPAQQPPHLSPPPQQPPFSQVPHQPPFSQASQQSPQFSQSHQHSSPQQAQPSHAAAYGYPQQPGVGGWGAGPQTYNPYGGGPGSMPPYGPPGVGMPAEPERRGGRSTVLLVVIALVVALGAGGSVYALMKNGSGTDDEGAGKGGPAPTAVSGPPSGSGEPTPTGSAPSPSASTTGAGAVPDAYLGTWRTTIDNAGGSNTRELTIRQGEVGDGVLTLVADGPTEGGGSYHCVFEAELAEQPSGDGPLKIGPSTVTTGEPASSCTPGEATEVTLLPDGRLKRAKANGGESLTYSRR